MAVTLSLNWVFLNIQRKATAMKLDLDKQRLNISCPSCKKKLNESIGRLKHDATLICNGCGATITVDAKQLRAGMKSAQKTMDDLGASIRKLFK